MEDDLDIERREFLTIQGELDRMQQGEKDDTCSPEKHNLDWEAQEVERQQRMLSKSLEEITMKE